VGRKYHILYLSFEETPEGRSYVGAHSTDCISDKYLGSFIDKTFNPTAKIIIGYFKTRESLLEAESSLQTSLNVVRDPHYANQSIQHGSGFTYGFLGKKHTPEWKEGQSQRNRDRAEKKRKGKEKTLKMKKEPRSMNGENNPRFGVIESPETRKKKSDAMVNRYWGNNGVEVRMFTPDKSLPEGWVEGRIKVPFLGTVKTKGKLWYNNGIEEKMFNPGEIPDEKWVRGRIKK
jgi:hypothetical protein